MPRIPLTDKQKLALNLSSPAAFEIDLGERLSENETLIDQNEAAIRNLAGEGRTTETVESVAAQVASLMHQIEPPNFILKNGIQLIAFDSVDGFETYQCTLSEDTTNVRYSTKGIRMVSSVAGSTARLTKTVSLDMSLMENITIDFYVQDKTAVSSLSIYISSNNFTSYFNKGDKNEQIINGWNRYTINKNEWTNTNSESWDNTITQIRFTVNAASGKLPDVTFDQVRMNIKSKAKCIITFDDGYITNITKAYPKMASCGMKGTAYIVPNAVEGANPNYMRKSDCDMLYEAGWDIANHTNNHVDLTTLSLEEATASIRDGQDWLIANGYERSARFLAYPLGNYNADIVNAAKNLGVLCARTTAYGIQNTPVEDIMTLRTIGLYNTATISDVKAHVDLAINMGFTLCFLIHEIMDTPDSNQLTTSVFNALIDYIALKDIEVLTMTEWYNRLINSQS